MSTKDSGPRGVRAQIVAHLVDKMPQACLLYAEQHALAPESFPPPSVDPRPAPQSNVMYGYNRYETEVLDHWPHVAVNVSRARSFQRVDVDATAATHHSVRYSVRVFFWCRAQEYVPTLELRDDYAVVMRSVLLLRPSITPGAGEWPPQDAPGNAFRVDESTMEETYSDASKAKGDRYVAGVSCNFDVEHEERLWLPRLGDANTATIEATVSQSLHPGLV